MLEDASASCSTMLTRAWCCEEALGVTEVDIDSGGPPASLESRWSIGLPPSKEGSSTEMPTCSRGRV
jgi:hypothetical protein